MKLADIRPKEGRFIPAVICYDDSKGIQHSIINQYVYPYRKELQIANNTFIFIDSDENITGGQVGHYDEENGLHTVFFTESPDGRQSTISCPKSGASE